jgi:hypothetical protein
MRPSQLAYFLWFLVSLPECTILAATNLLPGLTYYDGHEEMTGNLAVLLRHDAETDTNSRTAASIYEFDLARKSLRKLTDSPSGQFFVSDAGDTFCVIYPLRYGVAKNNTNAFIYLGSKGQARTIKLDSTPSMTVAVGTHVFFELEATDFARQTQASRILDYDATVDQRRTVELPGASKWQY